MPGAAWLELFFLGGGVFGISSSQISKTITTAASSSWLISPLATREGLGFSPSEPGVGNLRKAPIDSPGSWPWLILTLASRRKYFSALTHQSWVMF